MIKESKKWIEEFNKGNINACTAYYKKDAVMSAMPFGIKKGFQNIHNFWSNLIKSGANNLVYENVKIKVVDEKTVFLSAKWSMNIGHGIIFQEKMGKRK